jgi:hypothetical protein
VTHLEPVASALPMPHVERGAESGAVIAGGGLNVHVPERRLRTDLSVGDTVHRASTGQTQSRTADAPMQCAQDPERRLLVHALQRRGNRFVALFERLPCATCRTKQQLEFRGKHSPDLRRPVVPRHRHPARPVREIRQIETELAVIADVHQLPNLFRKHRLAVGSESHDLELVAVVWKPEELRQGEVEHAERVREEDAILDRETGAAPDSG